MSNAADCIYTACKGHAKTVEVTNKENKTMRVTVTPETLDFVLKDPTLHYTISQTI